MRLYEEGLVYRGERIINWCPRCMSAISDLEVETEDTPGTLYYVRYPLEPLAGEDARQRYITVATTRPETILGDTAVAVNPNDARYRDLVGRYAILPIMDRRIPIIADEAVDQAFGTGAVKVTPAHDPTDFEIGNRHNLPRIQVIGFDAKMTAEAGPFAGQDRYEARKGVVAEFKRLGLLEKEQEYTIPLGYCSRSHTIIEPLISMQWWVKMAPLANGALGAVQVRPDADRARSASPRPTRTGWRTSATGTSRASSGGATASPSGTAPNCGEMTVSREDPAACAHCGSAQDRAGPRRAGHLVQLVALAVQHARLARRHRRPAPLLSHQRAGDRLRHHLLLGRAHDDVGHPLPRRRAVLRRSICTAWCATSRAAR